jgi:uncharacterized protein (TIGR00252 family)
MTTYQTGQKAERAAALYLHQRGYTMFAHNWRTRYCEIDIVAAKNSVIYFVEVKYRATNAHGSGMDYVTPKKLQQMAFAAQMWVANNGWRGSYELAVAEVSGRTFAVTNFVEGLMPRP